MSDPPDATDPPPSNPDDPSTGTEKEEPAVAKPAEAEPNEVESAEVEGAAAAKPQPSSGGGLKGKLRAMLGERLYDKLAGAPESRVGRGLQALVVSAALVVALIIFGRVLNHHYPIQNWLFWTYAKVWVAVLVWLAACMVFGLAVIERLAPALPLRERLVQGLACGIYSFYALQSLGGFLHLFGPAWGIVLPLAMLGGGAASARHSLKRLWRRRHALRNFAWGGSSYWHAALVLFGLAYLTLLYLSILTPRNTAFDSVWYHLGLPQQWIAEGGIFRSPEGWFVEALPNLAAVLYSWGFQLPTFDLFESVMVAAHIEFVMFVATLACIPVLVRWLLPKTRVGASWVALFLFPSLFIYDAGLHTGNDHIAAFWAVPIFLALRRAWKQLHWRPSVLLAMCAAGAILTKYQAASLVLAPALAVVVRAVYLGIRRRPGASWLLGPGAALVAGLLFTAPLWAKNWLWYGDPFFPALYKHLTLRPWNSDMTPLMEHNWQRLVKRPKGPLPKQLLDTFHAGYRFSFRSYARGSFHGKWPYFGSLFTLSFLWLPFVRGAKRTWGVLIAAQLGVFTWFYMSHVERYLQALIPWMAAAVAAAVVLAWRHGWLARIPMILLVGMQVVWGGDALFLKSHAMLRDMPLIHSARLISSGFTKQKGKLRDRVFDPFQSVGEQLPKGSAIVLHDFNPRLGLKARVITDMSGFQGLIRYGLLGSAGELHDLYGDLGVTHLIWRSKTSYGFDSLAGDLRFFEYTMNMVNKPVRAGGFLWGPIKQERPDYKTSDVVVYAGCGPTFAPGLHHLSDMNVPPRSVSRKRGFKPLPKQPAELHNAIRDAGFVVYGAGRCRKGVPHPPRGFIQAANRRKEELWVRRWPARPAAPR